MDVVAGAVTTVAPTTIAIDTSFTTTSRFAFSDEDPSHPLIVATSKPTSTPYGTPHFRPDAAQSHLIAGIIRVDDSLEQDAVFAGRSTPVPARSRRTMPERAFHSPRHSRNRRATGRPSASLSGRASVAVASIGRASFAAAASPVVPASGGDAASLASPPPARSVLVASEPESGRPPLSEVEPPVSRPSTPPASVCPVPASSGTPHGFPGHLARHAVRVADGG